LNDPFWYIRKACIANIKASQLASNEEIRYKMRALATSDPKSAVRVAALKQLTLNDDPDNMSLLENALNDSSYDVISEALDAIMVKDTALALQYAQRFENEQSDDLRAEVSGIYAQVGDASKNVFFIRTIPKASRLAKYQIIDDYGTFLSRFIDNQQVISQGLPVLYDAAENNQTWWIRMKGMMSLQKVEQSLQDEKTELGQNSSNSGQARLNEVTTQLNGLNEKMEEIKSKETNEDLKSVYNR